MYIVCLTEETSENWVYVGEIVGGKGVRSGRKFGIKYSKQLSEGVLLSAVG